MQKPDISKLPTSQMMAFCQVFGLPQGGDNETKVAMTASLNTVTDKQWADTTVKFTVDQL
jgi:hypothetical protein